MASYTKRQTKKKGVVWDVRFRAMIDGTEKQIKLSGFATKRDAVAAFNEWQAPQKVSSTSPRTFKRAVIAYVEAHRGVLSDNTINTKTSRLRASVEPYFIDKRVDEITKSDVNSWALKLWQSDLKQSTCRSVFAVFKAFMAWASETYGFANPFAGIKSPTKREPKKEMQVWTADEFRVFLSALGENRFRLLYEILFYGGLREGEANALTAEDFEFKDGHYTVTVSKSCVYVNRKGVVVTPPKNVYSNRAVKLPAHLNAEIEDCVKNQSGYLWKVNSRDFRRVFLSVSKTANLPPIRVHDLRHSHATMLLSAGVPVTAVSKRLGHSSVKMTLDVYSHVYKESQSEIVGLLDKM